VRPKLYIETTVVGYLTARPSKDLIVAAHQKLTREWWRRRRGDFDLFVAQGVLHEAGAGDKREARRRLRVLSGIPMLAVTDEVESLARALVDRGALPAKAAEDALHVAVATVHEMDYLLTWNCRHIANAEMRRVMRAVCVRHGYEIPLICTPEELMGG